MRRAMTAVVMVCAAVAALSAQSSPAGGGQGRGAQQSGFGTMNTLTTIPEAGAGGGAGDPTAEQMEASPIRYIVIGHAHSDHTGGGEYLQRLYNPTILMGRLDWDTVMVSPAPHMRRGVDVIDGQKLTLGDTTLTLFLLPGHTPGSVSGMIPVKYQGRTYNMLNLTASRFSTYASIAPFERIFDEAKRAKAIAV